VFEHIIFSTSVSINYEGGGGGGGCDEHQVVEALCHELLRGT
jgi:hypothetical protein